jgi:hypothetical protein
VLGPDVSAEGLTVRQAGFFHDRIEKLLSWVFAGEVNR